MKKLVALVSLSMLIAGCATTSGTKNLSTDSVAMITNGKTTKEEVKKLFGEPSSKITMTNSMPQIAGGPDLSNAMPYEIWSYSKVVMDNRPSLQGFAVYALSGAMLTPTQTTSLAINFDKSGVVQNYSMVETK